MDLVWDWLYKTSNKLKAKDFPELDPIPTRGMPGNPEGHTFEFPEARETNTDIYVRLFFLGGLTIYVSEELH